MDRDENVVGPSPIPKAVGIDTKNSRPVTFGQSFDPRSNALNLLRLSLALLVIFSHSIILGGFGSENLWGKTTLGAIAVDAFFALSGFLIAASALRNTVSRYLWQRFLRIFPAFWACLVFTAVVAGPIQWLAHGKPLGNYWTAENGPLDYVLANLLLVVNAYEIAGTPFGTPVAAVWNGSLWTLFPEFLCYLLVAGLAIFGILRNRRAVLLVSIICWTAELMIEVTGTNVLPPFEYIIRFVPIYLAGVLTWVYRDKIPDSTLLLFGATTAFVVGTYLDNPHILSGPALAYIGVWAAVHLPGRKIGTKYDISYGVYIYAYVVGQLLATWNFHRWGYWIFCFMTIALTCILATLSCVLVEQPALRLKKWTPGFLQRLA